MIRRSLLAAIVALGSLTAAQIASAAGELAQAVARDGDPALASVYAARGYAPLWTGGGAAAQRRATLLVLLQAEATSDPAAAAAAALELASDRDDDAAELAATKAALAYLARRAGSDAVPLAVPGDAMRRLDRRPPGTPLEVALLDLEIVRALGGWRKVGTMPGPLPTVAPKAVASPEIDVAPRLPGRETLPEPQSLRRRLVQSGDLPASQLDVSGVDEELMAAVRRFQGRRGLLADGIVGSRTLAALNAPVQQQIDQVRLNVARGTPDRSHLRRYVEVNVPAFELRVVENGDVALRSLVIVGEKDNETPIFDDWIRYIEINPSWYVPASIVPELLEKEAARPGYLAANGFSWRGSGGQTLVQKPGPKNALGRIKFLFPNHHAVYLHDTSQRGLFGRSQRSLSHGCVRVEKPNDLAIALLGEQGWTRKRLDAAYASQKTQRVELDEPVPVFLDYRTAFIGDDGRLQLRADLYGYDRKGVTDFPEKGLPPKVPPAQETPVAETTPADAARDTAMGEMPAPL